MSASEGKPKVSDVLAERYGSEPSRFAVADIDAVLGHMIKMEDAVRPLVGAEAVAARAILALSRSGAQWRREAAGVSSRRPDLAQKMLKNGQTVLDQARELMADLIKNRDVLR